MRKKTIYEKQIRRKEREGIIRRLRKNAQLPDELGRLLQALPESIHELFGKLRDPGYIEWQESVAYILTHNLRDRLR